VNRLTIVILLSFIPLTGCSSSEPELSYDPVELIEYENCLTVARERWKNVSIAQEKFALRDCESKKPILK